MNGVVKIKLSARQIFSGLCCRLYAVLFFLFTKSPAVYLSYSSNKNYIRFVSFGEWLWAVTQINGIIKLLVDFYQCREHCIRMGSKRFLNTSLNGFCHSENIRTHIYVI